MQQNLRDFCTKRVNTQVKDEGCVNMFSILIESLPLMRIILDSLTLRNKLSPSLFETNADVLAVTILAWVELPFPVMDVPCTKIDSVRCLRPFKSCSCVPQSWIPFAQRFYASMFHGLVVDCSHFSWLFVVSLPHWESTPRRPSKRVRRGTNAYQPNLYPSSLTNLLIYEG